MNPLILVGQNLHYHPQYGGGSDGGLAAIIVVIVVLAIMCSTISIVASWFKPKRFNTPEPTTNPTHRTVTRWKTVNGKRISYQIREQVK